MALRLLLLPLATRGFDIDGCTSIVVNADAMQDGSAVTSHANDCADCDWRVAYVPAQDHPEGSERIIYDAVWSQYPRLVDPSRSKSYQPAMGITSTAVLGRIPQVKHTYALWEASYGLMNEHGVGMGESTCSAFLVGTGLSQGGTALFSIGNLMAIALERCKTARCAIQTMGDLGAFYGFYGEDPGMGGAGEAVTLVDQSGEAWVFHICGGVPSSEKNASWATQRGALWAAQRVPSGHVAVVANSMIIRQIDFEDKENFMLHPGLKDLLQEAKLWNGRGQLDWQKAVSPNMETFSYFPGLAPIPMYSTLRMWGVYRQAAPSAKIRATKDLGSFPFSVPVDGKVSILDVMNWFRTHYEGTEFDMRYGSLAGPFQSPNRAEGGDGAKAVPGQFARATSIPRTSYTVLLQSGIKQPRVWFAPDASASSIFVPFFASALDANAQGRFDVAAYGTGSMKSFSFDGARSAWWAHDFVANWMDLSYQNMSDAGGSELVGTGWKWEGGRSEACCRKLGSLERLAMPLLGPFVANTLATTDVQRRQLVAETHGALPWADRARGAVDGARGRALWIHSHERSNGFCGLLKYSNLERIVLEKPEVNHRDFDADWFWLLIDRNKKSLTSLEMRGCLSGLPDQGDVKNVQVLNVYVQHLYKCEALAHVDLQNPPPHAIWDGQLLRLVFGRLQRLALRGNDWILPDDQGYADFSQTFARASPHLANLLQLSLTWDSPMTDEEEPSELDHPHPFLQFFLMADLRRLRSLSLQGCSYSNFFLQSLVGFINRHRNSLEELQIRLTKRDEMRTVPELLAGLWVLPHVKSLLFPLDEQHFRSEFRHLSFQRLPRVFPALRFLALLFCDLWEAGSDGSENAVQRIRSRYTEVYQMNSSLQRIIAPSLVSKTFQMLFFHLFAAKKHVGRL
ncbi:unnamed protein product [Durusdinium trenchii]|uniref:Uncharacterized protein n=1 Tax=Durusdinium trenchii TaxID=1381693 RepID=A0ABP0MZK1_9DINO